MHHQRTHAVAFATANYAINFRRNACHGHRMTHSEQHCQAARQGGLSASASVGALFSNWPPLRAAQRLIVAIQFGKTTKCVQTD